MHVMTLKFKFDKGFFVIQPKDQPNKLFKSRFDRIQIIIKVFSLIKYFLSNKNLTSPILTLIINQTVINKS